MNLDTDGAAEQRTGFFRGITAIHVLYVYFVDPLLMTFIRIHARGVLDMILVHILPPIIVPALVPAHLTVAHQGVACKRGI